jgi:hypothetical protein
MKDVVIGSVAGVSAVLLMWIMRPALAPAPGPAAAPPIKEVPVWEQTMAEELATPYLPPTTRRVDPVRQRLDRPIPRLNVTRMPLDKVLDRVADASGVNLHVHWRALEAAGIPSDLPVTLNLQELAASQVLTRVLKEVGGGNIALKYRIEEGVVEVSTADDVSRHEVTRIYDVRDIIEDVLARDRRLHGPARTQTEDGVVGLLMEVLKESVEPSVFDGPPIARYFGGRLVVTRPPEMQDQVLGVLTALRQGNEGRGYPIPQDRTSKDQR